MFIPVRAHWQFWKEQDVIQKQISEERLQYEINRRLQPETEEDFDILYKELAAWQLAVCLQTTSLSHSE